jgi:hypothetical protein
LLCDDSTNGKDSYKPKNDSGVQPPGTLGEARNRKLRKRRKTQNNCLIVTDSILREVLLFPFGTIAMIRQVDTIKESRGDEIVYRSTDRFEYGLVTPCMVATGFFVSKNHYQDWWNLIWEIADLFLPNGKVAEIKHKLSDF